MPKTPLKLDEIVDGAALRQALSALTGANGDGSPQDVRNAAVALLRRTIADGRARAEAMLTGYAALAARNRDLVSVLSGDPLVLQLLNGKPEWRSIVMRQMRLFADVEPGVGGQIKAMILLSGFAGAARAEDSQFDPPLDEAAFRDQLIAAGRRTLGLRAPKPAG